MLSSVVYLHYRSIKNRLLLVIFKQLLSGFHSAKIPDSVGIILGRGRGRGLVLTLLTRVSSLPVAERNLVLLFGLSPFSLGIVLDDAGVGRCWCLAASMSSLQEDPPATAASAASISKLSSLFSSAHKCCALEAPNTPARSNDAADRCMAFIVCCEAFFLPAGEYVLAWWAKGWEEGGFLERTAFCCEVEPE